MPAKLLLQHSKYGVLLLNDNRDYYTHWCKMVTLVLKHRGFWDVVNGTTPAPNSATDPKAYLDWCQHNKEAQIQLLLALSHAPHNHILNTKTLKETWDLLKVHYQGNNNLCQHYLLKHLFTLTFYDMEPMEPQIFKVVSITCQLTDISFPISNQLLAGVVRVKLPEFWNTLKIVLANTRGGKQRSKNIISQILAKESRHIWAAGRDATAYFAKSSGKAKKKQDNRKKCTQCKCKGHNISECHMLKWEQEEKVSRLNTSSNSYLGKLLGKSLGKSSGKTSKFSSFCKDKGFSSAKITAAESDSDSDSNNTIQVFLAQTASDKNVE